MKKNEKEYEDIQMLIQELYFKLISLDKFLTGKIQDKI